MVLQIPKIYVQAFADIFELSGTSALSYVIILFEYMLNTFMPVCWQRIVVTKPTRVDLQYFLPKRA